MWSNKAGGPEGSPVSKEAPMELHRREFATLVLGATVQHDETAREYADGPAHGKPTTV